MSYISFILMKYCMSNSCCTKSLIEKKFLLELRNSKVQQTEQKPFFLFATSVYCIQIFVLKFQNDQRRPCEVYGPWLAALFSARYHHSLAFACPRLLLAKPFKCLANWVDIILWTLLLVVVAKRTFCSDCWHCKLNWQILNSFREIFSNNKTCLRVFTSS